MASAIVIIRHGETEPSSRGIFVGRDDPPLTDTGRSQAAQWRTLAASRPGTAFHSPLVRAAETARVAGFGGSTPSPSLLEWDLGSLEGLSSEGFRREHPTWSLFTDGVPTGDGESVAEVVARAEQVGDLCRRIPDTVFLFTHGQYARVLTMTLAGLPVSAGATFALGPGRAALLIQRSRGLSVAGWNLAAPDDPELFFADLT